MRCAFRQRIRQRNGEKVTVAGKIERREHELRWLTIRPGIIRFSFCARRQEDGDFFKITHGVMGNNPVFLYVFSVLLHEYSRRSTR